MNKPLFLFLNFLISSNLLFKILFFTFAIIFLLFLFVYEKKFTLVDGAPFGIVIWAGVFAILVNWIFKVLIFILLFQYKLMNTYMGQFFEKIKKEKTFKYKIILCALLCDIFCLIIMPIVFYMIYNLFLNNNISIGNLFLSDILCFIICGGGVTLSYLSLIIWLEFNKIKTKS